MQTDSQTEIMQGLKTVSYKHRMKTFYQWNQTIQPLKVPQPNEDQPVFLEPAQKQTIHQPLASQCKSKLKRFRPQRESKTHHDKAQPRGKHSSLEIGGNTNKNLFNNNVIRCLMESVQPSKIQRIHHQSQPKCSLNDKRCALKTYLEGELASLQYAGDRKAKSQRAMQVVSQSVFGQPLGQNRLSSQRAYKICEDTPKLVFGNYVMKRTSHDRFGKSWLTLQLSQRHRTQQNHTQQNHQQPYKHPNNKYNAPKSYLIIAPMALSMLRLKKCEKKRALSYRQDRKCNEVRGAVLVGGRTNPQRKFATLE